MDMKIFVVPIIVIIVISLVFFVHRQAEVKRQQEIERVVSDANQSLNLIESNRHTH